MAHGIPLRMDEFGALMASGPTTREIQKFAKDCVEQAPEGVSKEIKDGLLAQIDALGAGLADAVPEKKVGKVQKGNVWIEDAKAWKAGLKKSEPARPVVPLDTFRVKTE